mgnify:CR=1 FL=1
MAGLVSSAFRTGWNFYAVLPGDGLPDLHVPSALVEERVLAMEIAGDGRQSGFSELFSSHAFWLGSIGARIFNFFYIISALLPDWTVPAQYFYFNIQMPSGSWRAGAPGPYFRYNPIFFGHGFFVLKDVLLTIWVTVIVTKLEAFTASASGVPFWPLFLFRYQQGLDA